MKTIGLIGGMSWEITVVYYQLLNRMARERLGGLHSAKHLLWSFDFAEIEAFQEIQIVAIRRRCLTGEMHARRVIQPPGRGVYEMRISHSSSLARGRYLRGSLRRPSERPGCSRGQRLRS